MKIEPLEAFEIADAPGIRLTDQQTESPDVQQESGRLGTIALRHLGERLNPGTTICADRPHDPERFGPVRDFELGEITFVVWDSDRVLGCFYFHDLEPEFDLEEALIVRAQILPMFETGEPQPIADAELTGKILRHMMDTPIEFSSGRAFQVIEWTFPTFPTYRVNRPGLPPQNESATTLRIAEGVGNQERHDRQDNVDGSPKRIRHARAELVKAAHRGR